MKSRTIGRLASSACLLIAFCGCAGTHAFSSPTPPGGAAPPMTLPRFLGVDTVVHGVTRSVTCARVKLSPMLPMLEPAGAAGKLPALADPAALQSPAPAVAAAAAVHQEEAAAPGKIKALAYLAGVDCGRHPQVEEAFAAALDDPSDAVRIAAVQAVCDSSVSCGRRGCGCGGCCTPLLRAKLTRMAFERDGNGCWCEPNARVRRMARIALDGCGGPAPTITEDIPLELPPEEIIHQVKR
ncbi:MAG: hypothetical protein U0892_14315 [Pirellulales bacterium]